MATKLTISDLADVLAALKEVAKPYQLGIQLKIDLAELDKIEGNHPRDIDRQKTEVVKYWLRNSPDALWTTLANAVERMGGHARLAKTLREKEQSIMGDIASPQGVEPAWLTQLVASASWNSPPSPPRSKTRSLNKCVPCNILLLGKMGHGTSTLGNRILDHDGWFKINDQQYPQTIPGSSMLTSASQLKDYKLKVYDHTGLFVSASAIDELSSPILNEMNLVIFVLKHGSIFDVRESEILEAVVYKWNFSVISALVLTHCERLSEEEREGIIMQFKKDHPSIAKLMGKGILAVGFPDSCHVQPGSPLSRRVEEDKAKLRQLIYSCDVAIP